MTKQIRRCNFPVITAQKYVRFIYCALYAFLKRNFEQIGFTFKLVVVEVTVKMKCHEKLLSAIYCLGLRTGRRRKLVKITGCYGMLKATT